MDTKNIMLSVGFPKRPISFICKKLKCYFHRDMKVVKEGNMTTAPLSNFSRVEMRYLFCFTDVQKTLLEDELDLGHGWYLRKTSLSEMREKGVFHHYTKYIEYMYGAPNFLPMNAHPQVDGRYELVKENEQVEHRLCIVYAKDAVGIGPNSMCQALAISDMGLMIGATSDGKEEPYNHGRWHSFTGLGIGSRTMLPISTGELNTSTMGLKDFMLREHRAPGVDTLPNLINVIASRRTTLDPDGLLSIVYQFLELDYMPDYSLQKHLAYFSIIESIMTHSPASGDTVDTIIRQLCRNVRLVDQRLKTFGSSIPFECFEDVGSDTVIKALYGYRSAIAHGGDIKGKVATIDKLRPCSTTTDVIWMHYFLRGLTKRILQAAIHEPELINCIK